MSYNFKLKSAFVFLFRTIISPVGHKIMRDSEKQNMATTIQQPLNDSDAHLVSLFTAIKEVILPKYHESCDDLLDRVQSLNSFNNSTSFNDCYKFIKSLKDVL